MGDLGPGATPGAWEVDPRGSPRFRSSRRPSGIPHPGTCVPHHPCASYPHPGGTRGRKRRTRCSSRRRRGSFSARVSSVGSSRARAASAPCAAGSSPPVAVSTRPVPSAAFQKLQPARDPPQLWRARRARRRSPRTSPSWPARTPPRGACRAGPGASAPGAEWDVAAATRASAASGAPAAAQPEGAPDPARRNPRAAARTARTCAWAGCSPTALWAARAPHAP